MQVKEISRIKIGITTSSDPEQLFYGFQRSYYSILWLNAETWNLETIASKRAERQTKQTVKKKHFLIVFLQTFLWWKPWNFQWRFRQCTKIFQQCNKETKIYCSLWACSRDCHKKWTFSLSFFSVAVSPRSFPRAGSWLDGSIHSSNILVLPFVTL